MNYVKVMFYPKFSGKDKGLPNGKECMLNGVHVVPWVTSVNPGACE
jgi:hypothetical protein